MDTLRSLVGLASFELAVGLVVRDCEPLAMRPIAETLRSVGYRPVTVSAGLRLAVRNSLRVLRVAFHGLAGLPDVDPIRAKQFDAAFAALDLPGDPKAASLAAQVALRHVDEVFDLDAITAPLLSTALREITHLESHDDLRHLIHRVGTAVLAGLRERDPLGAPLFDALEKRNLLLDGLLFYSADQVRRLPAAYPILASLKKLDRQGLDARVAQIRTALALHADADNGSELRATILGARIHGLPQYVPQMAVQVEMAQQLTRRRLEFQGLMAQVIWDLDRLYRLLDKDTNFIVEVGESLDDLEEASPEPDATGRGGSSSDQYSMPLEGVVIDDDQFSRPIPNDPTVVFKLANDYFLRGQYKKAIRLYNRAIDLDPKLAEAHFNLSQAYLRHGMWSNALASYQQAVIYDSRMRMLPPEFEVEDILGSGGMGLLFKVHNKNTDRRCSIRLLKPSLTTDPGIVDALVARLKDVRAVEHASVVRYLDLRKFKTHYLLAAEYVRGRSLRQVLSAGRLQQDRVVRIARRLCRCLSASHNAGVVHNNLKPSCIFLGTGDKLKVSEFGLMGLIEPSEGAAQAAGLLLEYLAPEQLDRPAADERSDVYALCMILFEMIAGHRWEPGDTLSAEDSAGYDETLLELIGQGLAPDPLHRCLVEDILSALGDKGAGDTVFMMWTPGQRPSSHELKIQTADGEDTGAPVTTPRGMIHVPGGPYERGQDGYAHGPRQTVTVRSFFIAIHQVTNAEYCEFVRKTGHKAPHVDAPWAAPYNWKKSAPPPGMETHPVVLVSWHDAVAYAGFMGVRLPTEAEWEKAARGTGGRRYPWGDTLSPGACAYDDAEGGTAPVDAHPLGASPYGCLGMAGNVWEWCADWHDKAWYPRSGSDDPVGPDRGTFRVTRGGAFDSSEEAIRTYYRFGHDPRLFSYAVGFRVAKDVDLPVS